MATPNQIMARVYTMRVNRIAMQQAIKEKARLESLSAEERERERWAGLSPQERYMESAIEASKHFPKDMAVVALVALLAWGLCVWLVS